QVTPDTTGVHRVLARRGERARVETLRRIVLHLDAGRVAQDVAELVGGDRLRELGPDGRGVGDEGRHAHAGRRDGDRRVVHDLARLVDHLHLFGRVALVLPGADLGDQVEGDRVRVNLRLEAIAGQRAARRRVQLLHCRATGAGDGLVGRRVQVLHG